MGAIKVKRTKLMAIIKVKIIQIKKKGAA